MEELEMEEPLHLTDEPDDLCTFILCKFGNSDKEDHQHLCAVIGAMAQELKDQNLPLSNVAYFGATVSSLDHLSSDSCCSESPSHSVDALLAILSMIMPMVSGEILRKKRQLLRELVVRVIRSKSLSPIATASGLKCLSHLLMVRDTVGWSDVSELYGCLINFITDSRPKVRRQSHLCVRDVLQSFQGTSLLAHGSEGITNIFERYLLLAGGSNATASEGPKGAQEVLYVLDTLKDCLPYMLMKYKTIILKYFKTLLELNQPLVSRHITDCLNILCLHPSLEVSPDVLLDLLCSLAFSVSTNETSANGMTFTARLLDVGMKKIYALNRQTCVAKLPVVFNALRDILAFEYEEALFAATETMKNLLQVCIDEDLIQQGIDQILMNADLDTRKSGPTVVEKVCATIGSLLDYRYSSIWDLAFQVVSLMFDKLGEYSSKLLRGTLKSLAEMQKLSDEDFPYRKQLHECIGSALGAMGPEIFLSFLPLNLEADDLSEANVWLFPILKQHIVGGRLRFYIESLLGMVAHIKQKSRKLESEGRIFSSRSADALVYSLWSLLPSFCNYPLDTAESFADLEKVLSNAMNEEPDLCGIICSSLQILVHQNKLILEGSSDMVADKMSMSTKRAMARYTHQVASENLSVLVSSARGMLSILSKVFLKSTNNSGGCLQTTIGQFASIADKTVVTRFFKTTMQKLLRVTQDASKVENVPTLMQIDNSPNENSLSLVRAQLIDLAVSLLPGLSFEEIDLLFVAIVPALKDADGLIQKKAYKVLSIILRNSDGLISRKFEELLKLMIELLPSCQFSAKRHRLDCLYYLIVHVSKDDSEQRRSEIICSFLTEIILALKEVNKKTRNRAYDILVQIGHTYGDEQTGGKKENLLQFFNMVAGGLAAETPHMISAAVKGLARLAYEFSDLISSAFNVLPSTFLLLQRKNREIVKANLGLVKVLVAKSRPESLEAHLGCLVEGLLKWQDDTKNHFKAKVKHLLEMLVKKCGLDAVKAVMPEEHMRLLTHIRKMKERREKKLAANSDTGSYHSKASTSRLSKWNDTKVFSEFDDETSDAEYMDVAMVSGRRSLSSRLKSKASSLRSNRSARLAKCLPEDLLDQLGDEPLDLLDQQKTRSVLHSAVHRKWKLDSDDEAEMDSQGRVIIREEEGKPKREKTFGHELDDKSEAGSYLSAKSSRNAQKRRKTTESGWAYTGSEYASRKAQGDVKRKGKLEPYAYWPLDRKLVSRRPEHRAAARRGMVSVVKLTKKLEGRSTSVALSKLKKSQKGGQRRRVTISTVAC
ncbi:hypothetical protein Nepgr_005408 [Nepenthes gracilis]|uniref:RRP12-like protein n=1 Tax=Nepenthes gracilis TaxID=150966 RepID=A0AAD3XGA4_NEPGR|nr:hypothetical protein Nepgr_005408 [Nepenthes gracilis]